MSSMRLLLKMPKKVLVQFLTDRRTAILKTGTALRPGVYPEVHKEVEVLWGRCVANGSRGCGGG